MGLLSKSIVVLLLALAAPLLYRQFATDGTIKFMSSYYSNYKVIDQFLRQFAQQIEHSKAYLPNSEQVQSVISAIKGQFNSLLQQATTSIKTSEDGGSKSSKSEKAKKDEPDSPNYKLTNCPGEGEHIRLWSKEELMEHDGHLNPNDVLLGFLGSVYNVTLGAQHYGPEAEYNVFAGRDASRAFVTGNFTHDLHDDIHDIEEKMYSHVETWAAFYETTYPLVGRIDGRYYDSHGCATEELERVYRIFDKLAQDKANQSQENMNLPECNSEWNGDLKKGRVWCSDKSGGIEREWVGVPRILDVGDQKRCVCLNLDDHEAAERGKNLLTYPGCDPSEPECAFSGIQ